MSAEPTVFIVEDDEAARQSLVCLIESVGLRAEAFPDGGAFLTRCDSSRPGCLLLDLQLPGISGLDLLDRLHAARVPLPTIVITGHGTIPMSVRALKAGAVDFLEKPYDATVLLDRVRAALAQDARRRERGTTSQAARARLALLSPREREVLNLLIAGNGNKRIAADLGIAQRTVELHRSRIMEKTGATCLAALIRMAVVEGRDDEPLAALPDRPAPHRAAAGDESPAPDPAANA